MGWLRRALFDEQVEVEIKHAFQDFADVAQNVLLKVGLLL